jgi:phosphate transport system permease protein
VHLDQWGDVVFRLLCQLGAWLVIILALLLAVVLVWKSWTAMKDTGLSFFTEETWDPEPTHRQFGALAFIYGTVTTSAIAMFLAVPFGVGTAVFLSEIAPAWVRRAGSFLVEMLAAIPSVVYGFWGLFVLAPALQDLITALGGPNQNGKGILPAGLILSIMIVPYVAAVSFDVIRAVPHSQREGAFALGASRWHGIWTVVLPYARPGIIGGSFIALGRALGETMAVTMLIGNKTQIDFSPLAWGNSIASVIANEFTEASYDLYLSALVELGLVLLMVSVVVNSLARLLIWKVAQVPTTKVTLAPSQSSWLRVPRAIGATVVRVLYLLALPFLFACVTHEILQGLRGDAFYFGGPDSFLYCVVTDLGGGPDAVAGLNIALLTALYILGALVLRFLLRPLSRNRNQVLKGTDRLMTGVLGLCTLATVVPLFLILGHLIVEGFDALDWEFFVNLPAPVGEEGGGMANALYGSALLVSLATLFAIPIGLLGAIYLVEYRSDRLGPAVRFVGELLGGVPSIVIGIFAYYLVVRPMGHFSAWAGSFALGVMMVPIIMRASEEALRLVPQSIRQASHALGASHYQTVLRVCVPAALPAIITAVFLAIARIAGETAPLLLTAFSNQYWPTSPSDATPSLPVFIFTYATGPYDDWHRQAWAAALVLLAVVMLLNFGVRVLTGKRVLSASRAD